MKDSKQNIRYIGFHCTDDGGRRFDFSITASDQHQSLISVDVPALLFAGANRILFQEGAGICYSKIKELFGSGTAEDLPLLLRLTSNDVDQHRQAPRSRSHPGRV